MIKFEEALNIVLKEAVTLGTERVELIKSTGRVLAEDIFSDLDMPPFDKSAMDGYACRAKDLQSNLVEGVVPITLQMIETIPAGKIPEKTINAGQCSKIMTGAMLPEGADHVVMVEDTEPVDEQHIRITNALKGPNICRKAEDIKNGDLVIRKGEILTPAHIAVLAAVGAVNPRVTTLPRVGIISTGDELVEPDFKPQRSQIRNSNAWQIMAQAFQVPVNPYYLGIANDNAMSLREIIEKALEESDVVLLTGGVSMGDFDYVPEILNQAGVNILFKSIAIQPGKPTLFGRKKNQFLFGLPGNPVSSFVLFEMLVKPFLLRLMGSTAIPPTLEMTMGLDFSKKNSVRKFMMPVIIKGGQVFPIEYHGSAHINAYTSANGILIMEIGTTEIKKGEKVHVRPL
ncbi:MAG: molybdopterin molybdotransferase MoeA [Bacteroidales bacterium]|nr:molybdopterin molybdotransferase MoeA [Bacteroidales bacterium]